MSVAFFPTIDENPNFVSRPPDPGVFTTLGAYGRDALYHSPFSGTKRFSEMMLEKSDYFNVDGNLLDPKDANERYGLGGQLMFDEPIKESAADLMMRRKIAENDRNYLIQTGSSSGMRQGAGIGVSMAATLLDPINFASMFVPVVGEARFARMVQRFGGSLTKARLASGAIEGTVGAAMVEPFVLLPALQEQANYGLEDSAMNLAFGAGLGAFLHAGFGAIGDRIKKLQPRESDAMFEAAMNNILSDEPVTAPARMEEFTEGFEIPDRMEFGDSVDRTTLFRGTNSQAENGEYRNQYGDVVYTAPDLSTASGYGKFLNKIEINEKIYDQADPIIQKILTETGEGIDQGRGFLQIPDFIPENLRTELMNRGIFALKNEIGGPGKSQVQVMILNRDIISSVSDALKDIPRRNAKGHFLSKEQRLQMLKEKIDSERIRNENQGQIINQETKTNIPRITSDDLRNASGTSEVLTSITKEADELQSSLDRRVPIDDDQRIEFEAEQQAIKDEIKAAIGDPKKRETGVRAAIACITNNLI